MIRLKIYDFCHTCPDFCPAIVSVSSIISNSFEENKTFVGDTIVSCKRHDRCYNIGRHISDYMENKNNF